MMMDQIIIILLLDIMRLIQTRQEILIQQPDIMHYLLTQLESVTLRAGMVLFPRTQQGSVIQQWDTMHLHTILQEFIMSV